MLITVFRVEYHTIVFKDGVEVNGQRGQRQVKNVGAKTPEAAQKLIPEPEQRGDGTETKNVVMGVRPVYMNVLVEG
jgi:hypothetical protein